MTTLMDLGPSESHETLDQFISDGYGEIYDAVQAGLGRLGKPKLLPLKFFQPAYRRELLINLWPRLGLYEQREPMRASNPEDQSRRKLMFEEALAPLLHEQWEAEIFQKDPLQDAGPIFKKAWMGPYEETDAFRAFKDKVKGCGTLGPAEHFYARVIPLIQSSGVGKSRMLDECAKSVFTLPICLRPEDEKGYPPGDQPVVELLCGYAADGFTVLEFLRHLLEHTLSLVEDSATLKQASGWRTHLQSGSIRREFYTTICQRARQSETEIRDDNSLKRRREDLSFEAIRDAQEKLSRVVEGEYVLIYVDEAQRLNERSYGCLIPQLANAMSGMASRETLTVVLASADPRTSALPRAPKKVNYSNEVGLWGFDEPLLPEPWAHCPFKVFHISPQGDAPWTPQHARSFRASAKLGRPLWEAILRGKESQSPESAERDVKSEAFTRLNTFSADRDVPLRDEVLQAALVCRLALGIQRSAAGLRFASRLIAKRMAILHFVDPPHKFMTASYPVDPVLAWGAFQVIQLRSSRAIGRTLARLTESGTIERSPRGGLVSKLALMRAFDLALARRHRVQEFENYASVAQIPHFSAVSLGELLAALSGSRSVMDELDTSGKKPLRDLMTCGLVLAQWIGCHGSKASIDTDLALHALFTHCGLQLPLGTPGVDHMLVACREANKPISKTNMVVIMLQSNNQNWKRAFDVPHSLIDRFSTQGVPVVYILHEVAPKDDVFRMERDSTQMPSSLCEPVRPQEQDKTEDELQPREDPHEQRQQLRGAADDGAGDVWCLTMEGVHPDLIDTASVTRIVQAQSDTFTGRGEMSEKDVFQMLPMLTVQEGLKGPLHDQAASAGLFE